MDSSEDTAFEGYSEPDESGYCSGLNFKGALLGNPPEETNIPALKYSVSQEVLTNSQLNSSSSNSRLKMYDF